MATKTAGIDTEAIRQSTAARAYTIWESEGRPHGRDAEHWARAEAEVATPRGRRGSTKATAKVPPKVAAAMTAAAGENPGRATRATSKTTAKATAKPGPTGTRKKR